MNGPAKGVVALAIDKTGSVIASVADFGRNTYGGFTLQEGQEMRAKRDLAHAVVAAYCSNVVVQALGSYETERVMGALCQKDLRVEIVAVGHDTPKDGAPDHG